MIKKTLISIGIILILFIIVVVSFSKFSLAYITDKDGNVIYQNKEMYILEKDESYIFYNEKRELIKVNVNKKIEKSILKDDSFFVSPVNDSLVFKVDLSSKLNGEKDFYQTKEKIITISDIEGNFKVFSDFLINNKVIDNKFNWIFKKGHLVLNGDFFDRGNDVTAVLWLIYKLDIESIQKGGKVHFILGNHEELNLRGFVKYTHKKYTTLAHELHIPYQDLYGEKSELGRWLRTKNSMVRINNNLFCHGGISMRNVKENLTIGRINKITRKYLGVDRRKLEDSSEADLVFDRQGNMWYRGFFMDYKKHYKRLTENEVDDILDFYNVDHIIVGHTIVDKVKTEYNNKIIAIDVMPKNDPRRKDDDALAEKTEGLLIDGNEYFRLLQKGKKHLLF